MSWIGNVRWLEISGSRTVHDCGCHEGPSLDTQIHDARNSPHCVLFVSYFADRSGKLTLLELGEVFGFHLTAIPCHENTGFLSIAGIEEIFTFDWFMDCNVGFFTSSLDSGGVLLGRISHITVSVVLQTSFFDLRFLDMMDIAAKMQHLPGCRYGQDALHCYCPPAQVSSL